MLTNKTKGIIAIILASIMWSFEPILAKLSFKTNDIYSTFGTRVLFALIIITIYLIFTSPRKIIVKKKEFKWLIYLSIAATLFADFIYTYALSKVYVINAVLIGHIQPVFIIIIGYFFLKSDKLTIYDYFGIFFMILAGIFVTTKTINNLKMLKFGTYGDLLIVISTFLWSTTAIVTRKYLKELPAQVIAFYRFFFAGVVFFIFLIIKWNFHINNLYQILLGFVIGVGTILYYEGLKRIKAAQVSALELSTPFFSTFLGFILLKEYITYFQFIGLIFLVIGIMLISRKENI